MDAKVSRLTRCTAFCALLAVLANCQIAFGQSLTRKLLVEDWTQFTPEAKASLLSTALSDSRPEEKALALAGIARLALEDSELTRASFAARDIAAFFHDGDAEVVRQAMNAYVAIVESDDAAETEIVARARLGGGPLQSWEYVRSLRANGISSDAARDWLLDLARGPISDDKFSAAEALVGRTDQPPQALLSEVMQLIRSPEYFCYPSLTQFMPKFGLDAVAYLDELKELRVILSNRIGTAAGLRLAGSRSLGAFDLEMMDKAIEAIEDMGAVNRAL